MRAAVRKATTLFGVMYAYMVEYRGEIFFWLVATVLPLIMMGPWMVAGATGKFPIDQAGFARYFIAVFIIRQFSICWVVYEFEFHVVSGRLSPLLLVPIDPAWRFIAAHLAEQMTRLPFVIVMAFLAVWLFPQSVDAGMPSIVNVLLAVLATYAAFSLRFLIQYTEAMGALWIERVSAFDRLVMIPYLFLSGLVAPLEVFPEPVREVVLWTPFPYLVWFPARLLSGGLPFPAWRGFAVIAGWVAVMWVLNRFLWRRGLKRYSAMGA